MVGLTLLQRARHVGLTVSSNGDRLRVRGPRREGALARELIAHKPEVLAELAREGQGPWGRVGETTLSSELFRIRTVEDLLALEPKGHPPARCFACGSGRWWHLRSTQRLSRGGPWICDRCHPPQPTAAEIEWSTPRGAS